MFIKIKDQYVPLGNIAYIHDEGDTITVYLKESTRHLHVIEVPPEDAERFRGWLRTQSIDVLGSEAGGWGGDLDQNV